MKKTLGILGGMGPQATLDLQQKILDLTKAGCDAEHMRIFVDNHPQIPGRVSAVLCNTPSPTPAMQESLDKLIACGAECVVMPCVSAHCFLAQLAIPPQVVFLDMLLIVAQACASRYAGLSAGILGSEATAASGSLNTYLERLSIPYIYPQPQEQQLLGRLIQGVKSRVDLSVLADSLHSIAAKMIRGGADYFVLACTELPLIHQYAPLPYPCVDATKELAKAAILHCGYEFEEEP